MNITDENTDKADKAIKLSLLGIIGEANSSIEPSENKPISKKLSLEQVEYLSTGRNLFQLQDSLNGPRHFISIGFNPNTGILNASRTSEGSMRIKLEFWAILQMMKERMQDGKTTVQRLNKRVVAFLKKVKDLKEVIKSFFGDTVTSQFNKESGELCLTPV